jgi:hypothetical protein
MMGKTGKADSQSDNFPPNWRWQMLNASAWRNGTGDTSSRVYMNTRKTPAKKAKNKLKSFLYGFH